MKSLYEYNELCKEQVSPSYRGFHFKMAYEIEILC